MTREEILAVFRLFNDHPFGGGGVPFGEQMRPYVDAYLDLDPPDEMKTDKHWSADDVTALRTLSYVGADLDRAALVLGRSPESVVWRAHALRPRTLPRAWALRVWEPGSRFQM